MNENENLAMEQIAENVENTTTEETVEQVETPVKTYTQEEVDQIVGKRLELVSDHKDITDYFVSRIKRKKFKDLQLKFHSNTRFSLESATLECFVGGYIKR